MEASYSVLQYFSVFANRGIAVANKYRVTTNNNDREYLELSAISDKHRFSRLAWATGEHRVPATLRECGTSATAVPALGVALGRRVTTVINRDIHHSNQ